MSENPSQGENGNGNRTVDEGAPPHSTTESDYGSPEPPTAGATAEGPTADERYCTSCGTPIKREAEICPECGVRQRDDSRTGGATPSEPSGRYVASFVGGMIALFVGFVLPFIGQIAGGAVAGYLRGDDTTEGAIVGSLAGLVASIPAALVFFLLIVLGLVGSITGGDAAGGFAVVIVFGGILVFTVGAFVVLCAIGGLIGAAITDRPAP